MRHIAADFAALVLFGSAGWAQQGEVYGVVLFARDLMIPMRDGVKLAADVYRPAVDGVALPARLPILLQQTPYNKQGARLVDTAKYLASRGYVVVLQDDRGTYKSSCFSFLKPNCSGCRICSLLFEIILKLPVSETSSYPSSE